MSVAIKPHTALVKPVGQRTLPDGSRGNQEILQTGITVRGYAEQRASAGVFNDFGVDLTNPAVMMVDLADRDKFWIGDEVVLWGETYRVAAPPKLATAGDSCDHALIALQLKQTPLQDPTDE